MTLSGSSVTPCLLERHEMKYLIPKSLIDPVSDFVSVYCSQDRHSRQSPDGFYDVFSLYFDTPGFLFLKRRMEGAENRFNMRVRAYNDHSGMPCFFEVKQKRNRIVRKYRAVIDDPEWPSVFETSAHPLTGLRNEKEADNARLFIRLACSYSAAPRVLTRYRRKAFVSDVDDYARVTFDTDLRYHPEERFNLIPDENRMDGYDNETVFDPECNVILELKCITTQVPLWMVDLIRYFNLKRGRFSKYVESMRRGFGWYRYDDGDRAAVSVGSREWPEHSASVDMPDETEPHPGSSMRPRPLSSSRRQWPHPGL